MPPGPMSHMASLTAVFKMVGYKLLTHHQIHGVTLQWLNSFLHRWGQRIALEEMSMRTSLLCRVRQGAILSPELFNICMYPLARLAQE